MMFRALLFSGVMGLGAAGAAPAQGPDEIFCRDPGVRDGATLMCGGNEIRLWGIVAPEVEASGFEASSLMASPARPKPCPSSRFSGRTWWSHLHHEL